MIKAKIPVIKAVANDPNDNMTVSCAIKAKAKYIITRDDDMLVIGKYKGIKIVTPDFLTYLSIQPSVLFNPFRVHRHLLKYGYRGCCLHTPHFFSVFPLKVSLTFLIEIHPGSAFLTSVLSISSDSPAINFHF